MNVKQREAKLDDDRYIRNLKHVKRYSENPLVVPHEVKTKQKTVRPLGSGAMVDTITGEVVHGTALVVRQTVDEEHFVKVFAEGVKAAYDLAPSGYKVFQIVLRATQQAAVGEDKIYLHFLDAVEDKALPISRQTFHKGLKELLLKGFIAASDRPNMYWINPHLFFKGDRVAFVKEYVKQKTGDKAEKPAGRIKAKPKALPTDHEARAALEAAGQQRIID